MKPIKKALFLTLLLFPGGFSLFSQGFARGAILDQALYDSLPRKATQLSRSYSEVPPAYSLKQFTPYPESQGNFGTCTAWAGAFAARTIAESIALNRLDRAVTTGNVFSPIHTYKGMFAFKNFPDPDGQEGAVISWMLDFMKNEGPVKRPLFEQTAEFMRISLSAYGNARRYPIGGYATLYSSGRGEVGGADRTRMVKKSVSEGKPVIIGMNCPDSFDFAEEVWNPVEDPTVNHGGHAMCVVGYDDAKYGGAFEIQNSWGTDWGNGGYIWIRYRDFDRFAYHAYEMIENLAIYKDGAEYAGSVQIQLFGSGQGMPVRFEGGFYRTAGSYTSGTMFRYLLGNSKPAYVYAFAGDDSSAVTTQIFPPENSNISPALDYGENTVAFPGEFTWIQLDQRIGTDYLAVLYAKEELNLTAIRERFTREQGTFTERVAKAVGSNYIPASQARYETNEMRFSARSANPKAVFGLLLAINHR